jgi:polysaccharide export outer membrane protein
MATQPIKPLSASPVIPMLPVDDGYLLGPGDRLRIEFFNVPEFTSDYQVLPNGTVNLPQVGAVLVGGRTLKQANQIISDRFTPILRRPIITLNLLTARPVTIAIAGEVGRPGSYTLPSGIAPGEVNIPMLSRTIQLADGVTQAADLRRVEVRRLRPGGNGAIDIFTVDLWSLLQSGDLRQDVRLQDGDSVLIPSSTRANLEEARLLTNTNIAARNNRPLKITVVGEVTRPGPYTLLEGNIASGDQLINPNTLQVPSVTRAVQAAGGITQLADVRNIQVRRLTRTGPPQLIKLDLWKLLNSGDILQDLPLQDGDTVEVPTAKTINDTEVTELATASFSPDRITVNVVGEVEKPGVVTVPPNTPLNQAILSAGGFRPLRAKKSSVTLIRLNPNGTVSKRDISIDFAKGVNDQNNPALRNNDTIIVKQSTPTRIFDTIGYIAAPFNGVFGILRLLGVPLP